MLVTNPAGMMMLRLFGLLPVSWACSYVEIPYPDSGKTSYLIPRTMELWDLYNTTNQPNTALKHSQEEVGTNTGGLRQ